MVVEGLTSRDRKGSGLWKMCAGLHRYLLLIQVCLQEPSYPCQCTVHVYLPLLLVDDIAIINHHQPSPTNNNNHHEPSSTINNHQQPSSTIINCPDGSTSISGMGGQPCQEYLLGIPTPLASPIQCPIGISLAPTRLVIQNKYLHSFLNKCRSLGARAFISVATKT